VAAGLPDEPPTIRLKELDHLADLHDCCNLLAGAGPWAAADESVDS
jgi:hypothetical protein